MDPALGQRWADFLATLVHGSELSTVTVLLRRRSTDRAHSAGRTRSPATAREDDCSYAPGEDPGSDLSAEAVITHEYGHHVAANRSNAPWDALDYGPEALGVVDAGLREGAQGRPRSGRRGSRAVHEINPGEGWAEAYRVLNERKAGRAETPWQIVVHALYPTTAALSAAEQDVTTPWSRETTTTRTGRFTRATRTRTFTVATQLDGAVEGEL